ncbi:hypothetical protein DL764_002141 [Monosporascus ibericus]|uniref:Enhancer of polycomb-like protein n=1 Tax=Monosporascus ibericus TaxID=155417 RepID=A0A4Q4TLK6_9PEZI|nr:hypothetical protein DL764_002141 [Monosporascus ibericus]
MATRKVRYKKLNTKTLLPVLREDQIDANEYESLTTEQQIATGVEQAEENEYHLQAALKGAGQSTDNEIPVPPPQASEINYDELYPKPYIEPRNYIKFSDTVEETLGSLYDMTTEDDEYLKTYNAKKPANAQLSEDDFERIMEVFEDTASEQAPFAAVDNTVVPYETMAQAMIHVINPKLIQAHGKATYEYWKTRRQATGNKTLHPSLKFETHQEHDDMDPYVCFRRREVRQTRKTRARDVQVADKLKKLRRELEDGRQLVVFSHQRELLKREVLKADRIVFEGRARLKETKIRLNIRTDDEDLINTKPQKRPRAEATQPRAPHPQVRAVARPEGRAADGVDLTLLSDKKAERERELRAEIENKILQHRRWNHNYVDLTSGPLPPVKQEQEPSFRPAKTQQLMTPPASSASDSMEADEGAKQSQQKDVMPLAATDEYSDDSDYGETYKWRRRIGRNNRQWLDRRPVRLGLKSPPLAVDSTQPDQWKYDQDTDDEDVPAVYEVDQFSQDQMRYRAMMIPYPISFYTRRIDAAAQPNGVNRQALPQPLAQAQAQSQAQAPSAQAQAQAPTQPQAQPAQPSA